MSEDRSLDSIFPRIGPQIDGVASAIDQLAAHCERLQAQLAEAEDHTIRVQREYVTWVIEADYAYVDVPTRPGPLERSNVGITDETTLRLFLQYRHRHVAPCKSCGRRAPLMSQDDRRCAWGCAVRQPSLPPPR